MDLGHSDKIELYRTENNLESFGVGRIVSEHKERYVVRTNEGELDAELIGNMRFTAEDRNDFPAVGDWVAISSLPYPRELFSSTIDMNFKSLYFTV